MFSEISSIILREIIINFDDYESIINLKLTNKRLFKFINNDIVVMRYYLKLRYKLIINDNDLFKYIKLLDSKVYSKFISKRVENKKECFLFVNPENDTFVFLNSASENYAFFSFIVLCSEQTYIKISKSLDISPYESINKILSALGYVTLNSKISEFVNSSGSCKIGYPKNQAFFPGINFLIKFYEESFNQNILKLIDEN